MADRVTELMVIAALIPSYPRRPGVGHGQDAPVPLCAGGYEGRPVGLTIAGTQTSTREAHDGGRRHSRHPGAFAREKLFPAVHQAENVVPQLTFFPIYKLIWG
jgi:hypothetical protein